MNVADKSHWKFKTSPQVLIPEEMSPSKAQLWCNFVVVAPTQLPFDCRLLSSLLRKESPPGRDQNINTRPAWTKANTCSFIIFIVGKNRRLRIKQFLYDWAPPATDHPCLWAHEDHPFIIRDKKVGWLGTDFKGNNAGSAVLYGTMCEVSVLEGAFSDEELKLIYTGLESADMEAQKNILATPFSQLCYWARYQCDLIEVPFGLWHYRRDKVDINYSWYNYATSLIYQMPPAPKSWQLDSYCIVGNNKHPEEIESLYVLGDRDRYLWSRTIFNRSNSRLTMPPKKDEHPCKATIQKIGNTQIYHAWIDDSFGPHDAVWQNGSLIHMIQANSAVNFDISSFMELLQTILY